MKHHYQLPIDLTCLTPLFGKPIKSVSVKEEDEFQIHIVFEDKQKIILLPNTFHLHNLLVERMEQLSKEPITTSLHQQAESWEAVWDLCKSLGMSSYGSTGEESVLKFIRDLHNLVNDKYPPLPAIPEEPTPCKPPTTPKCVLDVVKESISTDPNKLFITDKRCTMCGKIELYIPSATHCYCGGDLEPVKKEANSKQHGGTHYQTPIQPWDFIIANKLGFLEGTAIKYIVRHSKKNGIEDIDKAIHYLEKLKETL